MNGNRFPSIFGDEYNDVIKNSDVKDIVKKSAPTANRYLARLVELTILIPEGEKKGRIYRRV